jgi:hypothetical protein
MDENLSEINPKFALYKSNDAVNKNCSFEFLQGNYKSKRHDDNSIFIRESALCVIEDLLAKTNETYNHYSFTYYDQYQLKELNMELSKRIKEIKFDGNFKIKGTYYKEYHNELHSNIGKHRIEIIKNGTYFNEYYLELNNNIEKYKHEMIEMIKELIQWLNGTKKTGMSILGIQIVI